MIRTWLTGMKIFPTRGETFFILFYFLMTLLEFALVSEKAIKTFCLSGVGGGGFPLLKVQSDLELVVTLLLSGSAVWETEPGLRLCLHPYVAFRHGSSRVFGWAV